MTPRDIEDMTGAQDEVLLPCPFCGGERLRKERGLSVVYIACLDCNTYGPNEGGAGWNRRADLARPSQAGDRQRVQAMHDANWKPAVTYWRERAEKAEAASQAGDERVARLVEAASKIADGAFAKTVLDKPENREAYPLLTAQLEALLAALAAVNDEGTARLEAQREHDAGRRG